ncbi:MAG: cysteine desulfurase family protein [Patescibacteria group bacterium]|jgi:cysteine desulfurase
MKNPIIYLDNAATTKIDDRVLAEMMPYLTNQYGNASSMHQLGSEAREAVESARDKCAKILNCSPDEIIFTSGGTESDYLALVGVMSDESKRSELIVSQIEHPAVLSTAENLLKRGFTVKYLPATAEGIVEVSTLVNTISDKTKFVSVMYANNEVGSVQPITDLATISHQSGAIFHTDACQAAGYLNLDVKKLGVDLLTLNGSKIYGPKGVGLLYVKNEVDFSPVMTGGGQENHRRGGTENVAGIVGLAKALEIAQANCQTESKCISGLHDQLKDQLLKMPNTLVVGSESNHVPHILNIKFADVDAQNLIHALDQRRICVSAGSACSATSTDPSHVLLAMGISYQDAFTCIRFSLGRFNTSDEIKKVAESIKSILKLD